MANNSPSVLGRFMTWVAEAGLYQKFNIKYEETYEFIRLFQAFGFRTDCYCPRCHSSSVFVSTQTPDQMNSAESALSRQKIGDEQSKYNWIERNVYDLTLTCARYGHHTLRVIIDISRPKGIPQLELKKIGQLPSKLDLLQGDLSRYKNVASDDDLRELNSASICDTHGFHVAAFVYLRRVFERRIEIAHEAAKKDASWIEGDYEAKNLRMDERIAALKGHLPLFLVENRKLYGILSKGVHELTEEECGEGFPAVYAAIGLILDQEISEREQKEKEAAARRSLEKLGARHGGN